MIVICRVVQRASVQCWEGAVNSFIRIACLILSVTLAVIARDAAAGPLKTKGLWGQFEERGWPVGYWPGQVVQWFNQVDDVGHLVSNEVALQLDKMRGMGVNTITIELRSTTPNWTGTTVFPNCYINSALGLQWPQPSATELA